MPWPDARELIAAGQAVLRAHDAGTFTRPSPNQYPHQWNWDSAFISLGWSQFDWERACIEIETMLAARWTDGMVPHIRYDPKAGSAYFPGADWWPAARARGVAPGQLTSGITNPPVLVVAARIVGEGQPDTGRRLAFWERVYPGLLGYVDYFRESRRLPGSPLFCMVHPWESGWDNSPRWDMLARAGLKPSRAYRRQDATHVAAGERPSDKDYDSFLALVELWDRSEYDLDAYAANSPFLVNDVLLDAIWHRAATDVSAMALALGRPAPFDEAELKEYAAAFEEVHWDEASQAYLDFDLVASRPIRVPTAAGAAGLAGGVAMPERGLRAWTAYRDAAAPFRLVPSVLPSWGGFDPARYWRGPVWLNVNWLIISGLRLYGREDDAESLAVTTLRLVSEGGMAEYFNALDGGPLGSRPFSWTAALVLDLLNEKGKPA